MLNTLRVWGLTILLGLFTISSAYAASEATQHATAVVLVANAVRMYQQMGEENTIAEINNPKGKFVNGDVYVFAYSMDGRIAAHPINPGLIGQFVLNTPDVNGKMFRKEIFDGVAKNQEVWVDYAYMNPVSKIIEDKTTYARPVLDKYIFAAGYYRGK